MSGHIQKAILRYLSEDKAGLVFEGMRFRPGHYRWKQIADSLQKLLDRGALIRVAGTQHCYREPR